MDSNSSHVYGIERHTICMTCLPGGSNRFALGTLGIQDDPGELHLVDYDTQEDTLTSRVIQHHAGLNSLASIPSDPTRLLVLNGHSPDSSRARQIEAIQISDDSTCPLSSLDIPKATSVHTNPQQAAIVTPDSIHLWDFHTQPSSAIQSNNLKTLAWTPNTTGQFAYTRGSQIHHWDSRTPVIHTAHSEGSTIRALDFNPHLPHILASAGDDGVTRLWDLRNPQGPLLEILEHHSYWIYGVRFNPQHDQLLATAGADGLVNLESAVSVSSSSSLSVEDKDPDEIDRDGLVAQFDDHETSVYDVRWSGEDPWVFASLSFGGRLVINTVPRHQRYKILL